jgi:hypothetical protein
MPFLGKKSEIQPHFSLQIRSAEGLGNSTKTLPGNDKT